MVCQLGDEMLEFQAIPGTRKKCDIEDANHAIEFRNSWMVDKL